MKKAILLASMFLAASFLVSCDNNDDDGDKTPPPADLTKAVVGKYNVAVYEQDGNLVKDGIDFTLAGSNNKVKISIGAFETSIPGFESFSGYDLADLIALSGSVGNVKIAAQTVILEEDFFKGEVVISGTIVPNTSTVEEGEEPGVNDLQKLELTLKVTPEAEEPAPTAEEEDGSFEIKITNVVPEEPAE